MRMLLPIAVSSLMLMSTSAYSIDFCKSADGMPDAWIDKISPVVSFFETSKKAGYDKITGDFDCQGLSAGVLQWNIGKASLQPILRSIAKQAPDNVKMVMGEYSEEFFKNIRPISTRRQLEWVRKYQKYVRPNTCGSGRGATWTNRGRDFSKKLSELMDSPVGQEAQRGKIRTKLKRAYGCSRWWAELQGRKLTITDAAFFYDTLTFNGTWWKGIATPEKVAKYIEAHGGHDGALAAVTSFLSSNPDDRQLQAAEAKLNADLWMEMHAKQKFSNQQIEMLVLSYLISDAIGKPHARKFKFLVISRRGTILFGQGYVNGTQQPVRFELD